MLRRRALIASLAVACSVAGVTLAFEPAAIRVGPNVRVSEARAGIAHNEILLSADPADPRFLLGCSMAFDPTRNKTYTIVYVSSDGGTSWTPTLDTADFEFTGDPACALGRKARGYYVALGFKDDGKFTDPIYRSGDSGKTWDAPLLLAGFHGLDRE